MLQLIRRDVAGHVGDGAGRGFAREPAEDGQSGKYRRNWSTIKYVKHVISYVDPTTDITDDSFNSVDGAPRNPPPTEY